MLAAARHAFHVAIRLAQLARAAGVALAVFCLEAWRLRAQGRRGLVRAAGRAQVALCHRLGATFIKVGQIASTRADLLPPELTEELASLRDKVPPFPFEAARDVIERSLGRPLDAIFASFE